MARCTSCGIRIRDDSEVCPLCRKALEDDGSLPKPSMYPKLVLKERVMMKVTQRAAVMGGAAELLLILINLTLNPEFLWCVITGTSILYGLLVLYTAGIPHLTIRSRFLYLSLGLILIGLAVDWVTGFRGWALSVALPVQILFMDIVLLVLFLLQRREFQQYLWMGVLNLFLCLIDLAAFLLGFRIFFGLLPAAFLVTLLEVMGIMAAAGKRTPAEFKRRFHA